MPIVNWSSADVQWIDRNGWQWENNREQKLTNVEKAITERSSNDTCTGVNKINVNQKAMEPFTSFIVIAIYSNWTA